MEDVPGADSAPRAYHNGFFDMLHFTRGHRSWEKLRGKAETESSKQGSHFHKTGIGKTLFRLVQTTLKLRNVTQ